MTNERKQRLSQDARFMGALVDGVGPRVQLCCPKQHQLTVVRLYTLGFIGAWFLGSEISERRAGRPSVYASERAEETVEHCVECGQEFWPRTPGQVTCERHGSLVMNFVNAAFRTRFICQACGGADYVLTSDSIWNLYERAVKDGLKAVSLPS